MKTLFFLSVLVIPLCLSLDNGVGLLPPMGWSTWCTDDLIECVNDYCDEHEIKEIADAMASNGMRDAGYTYVNLDDCWGGPRAPNGSLTADPERFPSGIPALADYVHNLGLKLGIYTCAGTLTCKGDRPGSWEHFDQDAQTLADWGVDYVKMDWCNHPDLPPSEVYPMMRDALNKTGRPMFFAICEWGEEDPWTWGAKTGNSWRTTPDHWPFWGYPDSGDGYGVKEIIEAMAGLSSYSGPGGWNDADFLMTGAATMTHEESRTEFSFWALWNSPLIVTTDIRDMTNKAEILLNKEIIAVNQDPLTIAGDRVANFTNGGQIWSKPLQDGSAAIILYNPNSRERIDVTVEWNMIWQSEARIVAEVRDLWRQKDLGQYLDNFTAKVEPKGVVVIKATQLLP